MIFDILDYRLFKAKHYVSHLVASKNLLIFGEEEEERAALIRIANPLRWVSSDDMRLRSPRDRTSQSHFWRGLPLKTGYYQIVKLDIVF